MASDRSNTPQMVWACRRNGMRHRLWRAHDAFLELHLADGRPWRFDLLDIGTGGVCFGLDDGSPLLESGTTIDRVVVHVAGTMFEGTLTIAHATEEFAAGTICGARFHPATPRDERKLIEVIVAIGG